MSKSRKISDFASRPAMSQDDIDAINLPVARGLQKMRKKAQKFDAAYHYNSKHWQYRAEMHELVIARERLRTANPTADFLFAEDDWYWEPFTKGSE